MTGSPLLLASVATLAEVDLALAGAADVIDLKDPAAGALGAWPLRALGEAVRRVCGRRLVSATVGDLPPDPDRLAAAARAAAATGVDVVKLGLLPGVDHRALAMALAPLGADGIRLVAVLMADLDPDLGLPAFLAAAGFHGVMLDTADKQSGSLLTHLDLRELGGFVALARANGLLVGLAGSLRLEDIAVLRGLGPDYLGFRGALCREGRTGSLNRSRLAAVRQALDRERPAAGGPGLSDSPAGQRFPASPGRP